MPLGLLAQAMRKLLYKAYHSLLDAFSTADADHDNYISPNDLMLLIKRHENGDSSCIENIQGLPTNVLEVGPCLRATV